MRESSVRRTRGKNEREEEKKIEIRPRNMQIATWSFLFFSSRRRRWCPARKTAFYHRIGSFAKGARPLNSARIVPGSARQRQESAKANIVIGGGRWKDSGGIHGDREDDNEEVEEA